MSAMDSYDDDTDASHPIDERAQAMELRDRFRRAMIRTALAPGVLCREKRGMGILAHAQPVMFWRWLDPADAADMAMILHGLETWRVHRIDCVVGLIVPDGGLMLERTESWRLERCDGLPED